MRLGRDRIAERADLFIGKRIGLVTNRSGRETIESFRAMFGLAALYAPEHGLAGDAPAGAPVPSGIDRATGLPIHSLYGETRGPTPAMLDGIDVVAYDIQDVATRCFTYVSTLAEVLRACGAADVPVVVLDRPDPLGRTPIDGPVLERRFTSFVGVAPVPLRYALTPGELASFYLDALGIDCRLTVVELDGWRRRWLDEERVPFEPPSPALRSLTACALYPGTVLFEGSNVSVGRGSDLAFAWVGASWLDAARVTRVRIDGVRVVEESGPLGSGVRIEIVDRERLRPVEVGVRLLAAIRDAHRELALEPAPFDRLAGTDALRLALEAGAPAEEITASWHGALDTFQRERARYVRYE